MLFFVFVAILVFAIALVSFYWVGKELIGPSIAISLLISFVCTLLVMLLALLWTIIPLECGGQLEPAVQTKIELVALQDSSNTLLRRSYSDNTMYYNYLYEKEGKGITMNSVQANRSYIKYINDNEKPYMIKTIYQFKNPVIRFFCIDNLISIDYEFYLPEGSVVAEGAYEIDLK